MAKPRSKSEYVWEWYREERPWVKHCRQFVKYYKRQINKARRRHDKDITMSEYRGI